MSKVKINIDGQEVLAEKGQTILEAAKKVGIDIPTLCQDDKLLSFGACRTCLVEVERAKGPLPACATLVDEGMLVRTDTKEIRSLTELSLGLLVSDHYGDCLAPCTLACPAGINVQGYVALIANGQLEEAVSLIKERNPFPAVCGRICTRPCEEECRRRLVDEPLAICQLKRFAADYKQSTVNSQQKTEDRGGKSEVGTDSPQLMVDGPQKTEVRRQRNYGPWTMDYGLKKEKVAIIGAGPAGLTCAYYLAKSSYKVTVFEALPEPGGMLRYGIPEYRLPKDILKIEIDDITSLGVEIKTNFKLGKDFTLDSLLKDGFKAIFLAVGAEVSQKMRVEGEDKDGVLPGIDFLRRVNSGERVEVGERVAVVGGGNTAIDAARTALRLGAEEVTIVYRRSRKEMPANEVEVEEAEEEGVKIHFLAAPLKVEGEEKVTGMRCVKMKLGELDKSGRPRPLPIEGSEFLLEVDTIIAAIGQVPADLLFKDGEGVEQDKRNRILVKKDTLQTKRREVFSGGDVVTGPATAVEAIADGRKAALSIDSYLRGEELGEREEFNAKKTEVKEEDFKDVERIPRQKMPLLGPAQRKGNFKEIELGFSEESAIREAKRCLECGCKKVYECELRRLATLYKVSPTTYSGEMHRYPVDDSHPFILRDPNKCILCGRCVRVCSEVEGIEALDFTQRGFKTIVTSPFSRPLLETNCNSCGQCLSSCPTGALTENLPPQKDGPWERTLIQTLCPYCSAGCNLYLNLVGKRIIKVTSFDGDNLCVKGRFGYGFIRSKDRLTKPLIRKGGELKEASWEEAISLVAKGFKEIKERYGGESIGLFSGARYTNEESYTLQRLARAVLGTNNIDNSSLGEELFGSFGSPASTNSWEELSSAELILAVGSNIPEEDHLAFLKIREALGRGGRLIAISPKEDELTKLSSLWLRPEEGGQTLLINGLLKTIIKFGWQDEQFIAQRTEGYEDLEEMVKGYSFKEIGETTGVKVRRIKEVAENYVRANSAMIVCSAGRGKEGLLASLSNLILLSGKLGQPGGGIIVLQNQNNAQGAYDLGLSPDFYPGYQPIDDPEVQSKFESTWGVRLSNKRGMNFREMLREARRGRLKALYILGEDPLKNKSAFDGVERALSSLKFLVVQDLFLSRTAEEYAHLVLPAASFAETEGTFTNNVRKVQLLSPAIPPLSGKENWQIFSLIAEKMGHPFNYSSAEEIMKEIASLSPLFAGISFERLRGKGLQWPCPDKGHPGTKILYKERFMRPNGRAKFNLLKVRPKLSKVKYYDLLEDWFRRKGGLYV